MACNVILCHNLDCSVSYTFGLPRHRENHDRKTTESSQWHWMVLEESQHSEFLFYCYYLG